VSGCVSHSPLSWFSVRHALRPKKQLHNRDNLVCEARYEAEETAEHQAQPYRCASKDENNAWFALKVDKLPDERRHGIAPKYYASPSYGRQLANKNVKHEFLPQENTRLLHYKDIRLQLYRGLIAVYSETHLKHTNMLHETNTVRY